MRLSILLKSLQQELVDYCDACVEIVDEDFFSDIVGFLNEKSVTELKLKRNNTESMSASPDKNRNFVKNFQKDKVLFKLIIFFLYFFKLETFLIFFTDFN